MIIFQFISGLSVDGDSQGVERLLGALSAHMWPGMILKSGQTISQPSLPQQEGLHSNFINRDIKKFKKLTFFFFPFFDSRFIR